MEITKRYVPPLVNTKAKVAQNSESSNESSLLQQILQQTNDALTMGTQVEYAHLHSFDEDGMPVILFQEMEIRAHSLVALDSECIGSLCVITFVSADPKQPLILGRVWNPQDQESQDKVINASESLTLKCGDSALEMEANGTVRIKGITVTTQAYGSNRIKGAAVKIN